MQHNLSNIEGTVLRIEVLFQTCIVHSIFPHKIGYDHDGRKSYHYDRILISFPTSKLKNVCLYKIRISMHLHKALIAKQFGIVRCLHVGE